MKSIVGASGIYTLGAFLSKSSRLILLPVYVRYLSAAEFGIVVFLEAITVFLSRILTLGMGQAVRRFYGEHRTSSEADAYVALIWCASTFFAAVICILLMWGIKYFEALLDFQFPILYIFLAVIIGFLKSSFNVLRQKFIARGEALRHGLFNILQITSSAGLIILFVAMMRTGIRGVLWAEIIACTAWSVIAAFLIFRTSKPKMNLEVLQGSFRYAIPMLPHVIFIWGLAFFDRLILERFVSLEALGLYGVGYQFASALAIISLATMNAWLVKFLKEAKGDEGGEKYGLTFSNYLLMMLILAAALTFLSREVIIIISTEKYIAAYKIMRVVIIAMIFYGIYQAFLLPLYYLKKTTLVPFTSGLALSVNIGLNILFIPRYGIIAAAWSTLVAYVSCALVTCIVVMRHYKFSVEYKKIFIGIAILVSVALILNVLPTMSIALNLLTKISIMFGLVFWAVWYCGFINIKQKKDDF